MALTDLAQPDDDTHNLMRVAQDIPSQTAATVWPLVAYDDGVPYRKDGITDWSQVDDDLSASTIKAANTQHAVQVLKALADTYFSRDECGSCPHAPAPPPHHRVQAGDGCRRYLLDGT